MIAQLRTYTINKGMMDDWLKVLREDIVPLCRSMDTGVESAWVNDEGTQFTWIRTFEDADDIERKEAAMLRERVEGRERHIRPWERKGTMFEGFMDDRIVANGVGINLRYPGSG